MRDENGKIVFHDPRELAGSIAALVPMAQDMENDNQSAPNMQPTGTRDGSSKGKRKATNTAGSNASDLENDLEDVGDVEPKRSVTKGCALIMLRLT